MAKGRKAVVATGDGSDLAAKVDLLAGALDKLDQRVEALEEADAKRRAAKAEQMRRFRGKGKDAPPVTYSKS